MRRGAFGQQVQRAQNRQAGFDQGIELLVENQEIVQVQLAGTRPAKLRKNVDVALDRKDVQSAVGELLANLSLRLRRLQMLEDAAVRVPDFADVLGHDG